MVEDVWKRKMRRGQAPCQLSLSVVIGQRHGRHLMRLIKLYFFWRSHLSVFVVVLALQVEGVLLDLGVTERLEDA